MTLLQRRPREVYRVFDEDEFLLGATHEHRALSARTPGAERRARRIVAASALVAAAGALTALVALANILSVSGPRRRPGSRLSAATASSGATPSSSTHVGTLAALRHPMRFGGSRAVGAGVRSRRIRSRRRARADARSLLKRGGPRRTLALVVAAAPRRTSVTPAAPAGRASSAAGGSQSLASDRPEFGFER
jgi:hypothetical protein